MSNPVVKYVEPSGILDGTKATSFRQEISEQVDAGAGVVVGHASGGVGRWCN